MSFANHFKRQGAFKLPPALRLAAKEELKRLRSAFRVATPSPGDPRRPRYASRSAYYRHCKATLRRALAPYWSGSHTALKLRLRALLHARRRDIRLLSGLLRAAATPAALAIFMLAANATPAHAKNLCYFTFSQYVGQSNPFDQINLGNFSAPNLVDLDADGDYDAVVGAQDGIFNYFKNTGTIIAPTYVKQNGVANPFNGIDVGYASVITFGDIDGDGDLDAFTGSTEGTLRFFRNTGNRTLPAFTEVVGGGNPFNGVDLGQTSAPALVDLDGDGDLDLVAGEYDGTFNYFRNNGNVTFPTFSEQTGAANPFNGFDVDLYSRPAFLDVDKDGDLDMFSGSNDGDVHYFENIGTPLAPVFVERVLENPMLGFDAGDYSHPAFGDLDGDGDLDTLIGGSALSVICAQNFDNVPLPVYDEKTGADNPFSSIIAGVGNNKSAPTFGDIDADGDLDAFIGDFDGTIRYFKNTGSKINPIFEKQNGPANPLNGTVVLIGHAKPALVDLDGDGDLDVILGNYIGQFYYLENTGTPLAPVFERQFGSSAPLDGVDVSFNSTPAIADIDGDGDFDVLSGSDSSLVFYFKNYGSATAPLLQVSPDNFFPNLQSQKFNTPSFVDMDRDGALDAVIGTEDGKLHLFLNKGTPTAPSFESEPNPASPLFRVDVGNFASPTFADLDGDGDMDAIVGKQDGSIAYFERTNDCAPLSVSCQQNITVSLNEFGAHFFDPAALDGGNPINTALTVSPPAVNCSNLGAPTSVTLNVTNLFGLSGSCQVNVTAVDATGPTITLNGNPQLTLQCGDTYNEPGASVYDACDAFVDVVIGGDTVDTGNARSYVVTYTATDGSGNTSQVNRTVTVQGGCSTQDGVLSADQDANFVISLSELLRVIQFYNSLGLHCANSPSDTEDGYIPGPGANKACPPYDTDYNPQDWVISLSELLRAIQFYNSIGYTFCPNAGTEDGFCPGP